VPATTAPYIAPAPAAVSLPFTDVPGNAWYYSDVTWAYARGLMVGTGAAEFSPNTDVSRGMLVTVLYRLAGEPPVGGSSFFSDVPAGAWYANAVAWAKASGIVSGVGDDLFAPNASITREQVAAILLNYARFIGVEPQGSWAVQLNFTDVDQISDWAVKGAMYAYMKGVITGKPGQRFDPKGAATRAEISAILHRFVDKAAKG
jgi:hypothetical protein